MPTIDVTQRPFDGVSPTLLGNIPDSTGHYQVSYTWSIDATTLQPVYVSQTVTLGAL